MNRRRAGKAPEENDEDMDMDADERGAIARRSGRQNLLLGLTILTTFYFCLTVPIRL